jgi:hypothetical protein
MTMMQIFAGSATVVAILVAGSYLLPRQVEVSRSARLPVKPETVLALAASNSGYQRFNPYMNTDPELKISHFGPDSGVGSGFRFNGREGTGSQTVAAVSAETVTYQIDLGAMGRPVQQLTALPEGDGSRVTWTMQTDLGINPVFRVFGLFMDRMMGKVFERGLANLANVVD